MTDEAPSPEDRRKAVLAKAPAARVEKRKQTATAPVPEPSAPPPVAAVAPVDPDNVTLSDQDMERIRAKARAQVANERKKALEAQALEAELEKIRGKAGQVTGNPEEDRLVDITISMGENSDGPVINGRKIFHGQTVTVPLHVARSLNEIMFRSQTHEHDISGKARSEFYRKPRHVAINRRNAAVIEKTIAAGTGSIA